MISHVFFDDDARRRASPWLFLASAAVALSGGFAILIALARVPALGVFFPGGDFYRVALTMHVSLSQGVWFMSCASFMWVLADRKLSSRSSLLACCFSGVAVFVMLSALAAGELRPVMSNYFPVLDGPLFLTGAMLFIGFAGALALRTLFVWCLSLIGARGGEGDVFQLGLALVAAQTVLSLAIGLHAAWSLGFRIDGDSGFEALFWAAGHTWQFALVSLMMLCWLALAGTISDAPGRRLCRYLLWLSFFPGLLSLYAALHYPVFGRDYFSVFTELMRWGTWPAPLALAGFLCWRFRGVQLERGFALTLALLLGGIFFGTLVSGETTIVTAHYHGTVGAVTLSLMLVISHFGKMWWGGSSAAGGALTYGCGVFLMMLGLAGAGLSGAPRKLAGDLSLTLSLETISRLVLGLGGLLATIGLLIFAVGIVWLAGLRLTRGAC